MPLSISYDAQHVWLGSGTNYSNRPYSNVTVRPLSGSATASVSFWALLDTGADYLCLDDAVAKSLKINLSHPTRYVTIATALGSKSRVPLVSVNLEMEGYAADVDAIFDSAFRGTPLVGRCALVDVIKFGIDLNGWLFAKK